MATEKRLIYADTLYETIANSEATSSDGSLTISEIAEFIEAQPTVDAMEVVRCWECKYGDMCSIREAMAASDWNAYCYRGERKRND